MNFPFRIDDKQRPFAHTIFVAINTVAARHVPLWFKVGQKGEMKLTLARECGVAPRTIHRNADQLRTELVEFLQHFVVESHLIAADRTPIGRIKGEHDRLATELAESEPLIRRASQREVGRIRPRRQRCAPAPEVHFLIWMPLSGLRAGRGLWLSGRC